MQEGLKLLIHNYMNNIFKKEKGFSLIEILISILIVAIAIVYVYRVISKYNTYTQKERESFVASYLCQEGIEIVKNMRDSNWIEGVDWDNGLTSCTSGCEADHNDTTLTAWSSPGRDLYIENVTGSYEYIASPVLADIHTSYKRRIEIVNPGPGDDELDITVIVYWGTNAANAMVVKENIFNWK